MAITPVSDKVAVDNPLEAIRNAWTSGQDIEQAVYGSGQQEETPVESNEQEVQQEEPVSESQEVSTPEVSQTEVEVSTPSSNMDVETVYVRGVDGKKQKVEISYNDKEKIKRAFLKMAGMDKFRAERDQERKSKAELQAQFEALSKDFGTLESIFKEKGAKGIFEKLGGQGAFERAVEEELARRERLASMSPEEHMQMQFQEKERSYQAEKSAIEQKYSEMMAKIEADKEAAAAESIKSQLLPAFDKYRYAGRLGDDVAEAKIDKAIWNEVRENLAELVDKGVDLTPSLIEKEFRSASSVYSKMVNSQVDSKLKATVAKKKEDAAQRAQIAVKKGITTNTLQDSVKQDIENNNWSSLMQKVFSGKVSL